ncbi:MAG: sulfatase-like hydrolase/transferase [Bryobacterales bacterium]|nr:sulfatase-like hydrolase/transferase [Bryobacterales bacterium]
MNGATSSIRQTFLAPCGTGGSGPDPADLPRSVAGGEAGHHRVLLHVGEPLDHNIGRVLDKLRQLNLENDTLVVYMADHGYNRASTGASKRTAVTSRRCECRC